MEIHIDGSCKGTYQIPPIPPTQVGQNMKSGKIYAVGKLIMCNLKIKEGVDEEHRQRQGQPAHKSYENRIHEVIIFQTNCANHIKTLYSTLLCLHILEN